MTGAVRQAGLHQSKENPWEEKNNSEKNSRRHRRCFNTSRFASWRVLVGLTLVYFWQTSAKRRARGGMLKPQAPQWRQGCITALPRLMQRVPLWKRAASCSYRKCLASLIRSVMGHLVLFIFPAQHNTRTSMFFPQTVQPESQHNARASVNIPPRHTYSWRGDKELPSTQAHKQP